MLGCVWIEERILGSGFRVIWEKSVNKVRLFGLGYIRVDLWGKFIEICVR